MIGLVQRVTEAAVAVNGERVGRCGKGLLIFLGIAPDDTEADVEILSRKIAQMRIFEDAEGKMNLSVLDIGGDALVISQFTLCADLSHGNRPSFTSAAPPAAAEPLYEAFLSRFSVLLDGRVEKGVFGADMQVSLCNDGPATFITDSTIFRK